MSQLLPPPTTRIRGLLETLDYPAVKRLSVLSKVPVSTIWKIRQGLTENPGMETVRQFVPYIRKAKSA